MDKDNPRWREGGTQAVRQVYANAGAGVGRDIRGRCEKKVQGDWGLGRRNEITDYKGRKGKGKGKGQTTRQEKTREEKRRETKTKEKKRRDEKRCEVR